MLAALAAAGSLLAAGTAPPPAPAGAIALEPYIDTDHWAFRGKIDGHDALFQLDTGGGLTVVTPKAAAEARCRVWGRFTGFRMRGDRLDLQRCDDVAFEAGGLHLGVPAAGVWDLTAVLPKDAPELAGSVGLDAFGGRAVTLDLAHRQLIVESPASLARRIKGAREVPAHLVREVEGYATVVAVGLDTPSGRIWLTLDSGNDAPLTIGRHVASLLGIDPDKKTAQPLSATLAGGVPLKAPALARDLILDGNIGVPVLRSWTVTFDLPHERVWIAPAESAE